jgi:hypothetical protein
LEPFTPYNRVVGDDFYDGPAEVDGDGFGAGDGRGRFGAVGPYDIGSRELGRGHSGVVFACRASPALYHTGSAPSLAIKVLFNGRCNCAGDMRKIGLEVRHVTRFTVIYVAARLERWRRARRWRSARGSAATVPSPLSSPRTGRRSVCSS